MVRARRQRPPESPDPLRAPAPSGADPDVLGGAVVGGILGAPFGPVGVVFGVFIGGLVGKNVSNGRRHQGP